MQGLPCVKFGRVVIGVLPLVRMYKFPSRAFGEREQESKTTFIQTQRPLLLQFSATSEIQPRERF